MFVDAIHVKARDGQVTNRPFYVVVGVTVDGRRDVLGIWAGEGGEGARYWLQVLTEIVADIDDDTHTAAKCNFCAHRVDEKPGCRLPGVASLSRPWARPVWPFRTFEMPPHILMMVVAGPGCLLDQARAGLAGRPVTA